MLNGAAVSWRCTHQSVLALSTAEAEFIAASSMVQEVIFIRKFLDNLGFKQNGPTPIFADNETCMEALLVAVIVQSTLISASILFTMRANKTFSSL